MQKYLIRCVNDKGSKGKGYAKGLRVGEDYIAEISGDNFIVKFTPEQVVKYDISDKALSRRFKRERFIILEKIGGNYGFK